MERRQRGSGQVTHVACRECCAPVLLDPDQMDVEDDAVTLVCESCGTTVPVRRFDAARDACIVEYQPRTSRGLSGRLRRIR